MQNSTGTRYYCDLNIYAAVSCFEAVLQTLHMSKAAMEKLAFDFAQSEKFRKWQQDLTKDLTKFNAKKPAALKNETEKSSGGGAESDFKVKNSDLLGDDLTAEDLAAAGETLDKAFPERKVLDINTSTESAAENTNVTVEKEQDTISIPKPDSEETKANSSDQEETQKGPSEAEGEAANDVNAEAVAEDQPHDIINFGPILEAYKKLGSCFMRLKEFQKAIDTFQLELKLREKMETDDQKCRERIASIYGILMSQRL